MLSIYKHFSFDLWLTLIRSNPGFKQQRALYFHQKFNFNNKSLEEVTATFRQVDVMCNLINEKTGKNIDADEMYLMVLSIINDAHPQVWQIDINQLYTDMEALVFNYMPQVYCPNTMDVLARIKENGQRTANILSNTGFIKGVTLRKVLNQIGMDRYFDFQLYSDEAGMSKPNPGFFNLMLTQLKTYHQHINLENIVHIGDNPIADVGGAASVGIHSRLINSNNSYLPQIFANAQNVFTT